MPIFTTNYDFALPLVNNAVDQDRWGNELNDNFTSLDSLLFTATNFVTSAKVADYTVTTADTNTLFLISALGAARTVTLPAQATVPNGFTIAIKKNDGSANTVTIDPDGAELIDSAANYVLDEQNEGVILTCRGAGGGWWIQAANKNVAPASTTVAGVIEIATDAEVKAGTDTNKAVVPSSLAAAVGFTKYYESSPTALATSVSVNHGLGAQPKFFQVVFKCISGALGYSVGDEVFARAGDYAGGAGGATYTNSQWATSTQVGFSYGTQLVIANKTTGALGSLAGGSWQLVFRAWA